jgi:hypothetical protein
MWLVWVLSCLLHLTVGKRTKYVRRYTFVLGPSAVSWGSPAGGVGEFPAGPAAPASLFFPQRGLILNMFPV